MRVHLIHIRDPQFYAVPSRSRGANGRIQIMGFPPLGIMTLSAVLKDAGHECAIYDQANPEIPDEEILADIVREKPDLVGLSFLSTTSYPFAKILARRIREAAPDVKLAFGGVFASLNAVRVKRQCPYVDFVCRGDGEQLILDLLDHLDDPSSVAGVTWARNGDVIDNPGRKLDRNMDQWPIPDRESLPIDFVESMPLDVPVILSRGRYTTMQTSRGCPWPCVFCDIPAFSESKWRPWSPESVVAELARLERDGYESVFFVDDNFLLQPKRIQRICELYIEAGLRIYWGCEGRVDNVAQHLFPLMARANCRTVMFGIESGSQKILDRLEKRQTLEEIEIAVRNAKNAGIEIVHGFFLVGVPDETREDLAATFDFAAKLPLDTFGFNRLCVYRGSPLWREYLERGLVDDERDWFKYFKCTEIDPTCLSGEEVNAGRKAGLKRLIAYKFARHPRQTLRLLRRLLRHMPAKDLVHAIVKPFLGRDKGATRAEILSRAVEQERMKDHAADLTQISDEEMAERFVASGGELRSRAG